MAALAFVAFFGCGPKRLAGPFHVLPGQPDYSLQSPDATHAPFPEILARYNGFTPGGGWLDLRPQMELRIENSYYETGKPRRGLSGFLGTEIVRYDVGQSGSLRMIEIEQTLPNRPPEQAPAKELIRNTQSRFACHRYFYAILFKRNGESRGSVLLGAKSARDMERLAAALVHDPDALCSSQAKQCTVFPEACTVAIEMRVVANGVPRRVPWGTSVASVVAKPSNLEMLRVFGNKLTPVEIDARDMRALQMPLLPGDHIRWN